MGFKSIEIRNSRNYLADNSQKITKNFNSSIKAYKFFKEFLD